MTQETWLLTGGAGYIGTHIADEFIRNGKNVVIYDSLYQGFESRKKGATVNQRAATPTLTKNKVKNASQVHNKFNAGSLPVCEAKSSSQETK